MKLTNSAHLNLPQQQTLTSPTTLNSVSSFTVFTLGMSTSSCETIKIQVIANSQVVALWRSLGDEQQRRPAAATGCSSSSESSKQRQAAAAAASSGSGSNNDEHEQQQQQRRARAAVAAATSTSSGSSSDEHEQQQRWVQGLKVTSSVTEVKINLFTSGLGIILFGLFDTRFGFSVFFLKPKTEPTGFTIFSILLIRFFGCKKTAKKPNRTDRFGSVFD